MSKKTEQKPEILEELLRMSAEVFPEQKDQIEEKTRILAAEYCKAEEGKEKEVTMHTVGKIFPCIAFYQTVIECTGDREQAYAIVERYFTRECEITAQKLQKICRIPFLYRLVPRVMAGIIHKTFGVRSGFEMVDHSTKGKVCHIDMVKCPYHSNCVLHGCPELTTVFCNGDDISYGNMNPKLSWERSKTLGRGDDCCDFILRIKGSKS